jgi:hypothetical protein
MEEAVLMVVTRWSKTSVTARTKKGAIEQNTLGWNT